MKYISCLLALLVLTSCRTIQENQGDVETGEHKQGATRTVRIETDPPKRKIMINEEYVGDSPISVKLAVFDEKYKYSKFKERYTIEAYPKPGDAQSQIKFVELTECDECGDEKPFRIFMDMSLRFVNTKK